jgi:hypothetical protein
MLELIPPHNLKVLVEANAIHHATVVADQGVFKIHVNYDTVERAVSVRTRDGQIRERAFSSLDAAARFMRDKVHLSRYEVDVTNFKPDVKVNKRPDMSKRLSSAHAALSHQGWAQQKVQASRAGLKDGSNKLIEPEDWEDIRAAKQRQRDTR